MTRATDGSDQHARPAPRPVLGLLGAARLHGPAGTRRLERRPAAVCAYLAIEGRTPKHALAELLWPGSRDGAARANLRQLLHRMRANGADLVDSDDDFVALRPEATSDVAQFTALDLPRVVELGDAGPLLAGYDYDDAPDFAQWLDATREQLRRLHLRAIAGEADRFEAQGDYGRALRLAQAQLHREPLTEDAHRRAMRLHYLLGDRAAALAAFQRCQRILAEELGTRPMPETLALAREIERGVELPRPAPPTRAVPLAMLRPPVLVGRERAWAAMEEAWRLGQLIVVSGPAGAGKTRLVEDFAATKGPALRIEGRPGDAQVPYASVARNQRTVLAARPELSPSTPNGPPAWAWREAARLAPDLGEAPPASAAHDKLRFYDGLMAIYMHCIQGLAAMIVDDLHFYDDASLEMSTYAIAKTVPLGAGMPHHIVAFRDDEAPRRVLEDLHALLERGMVAWIRLDPLDGDAVGRLVASLQPDAAPGLAPALARYTGGNPLFVIETVRHLHQTGQLGASAPGRLPLAGRVRELTARRLGKLSAAALELARAAAVLRSDFGFEEVCAAVGRSPADMAAAWQELEAAQIMSGERFSHDLLLEAVLADLPKALRRWLHRSVAALLAERGANPARVAQHWLDGGDPARAADWWLRAAADAERLGLLDDAQTLLRQAADAATDEAQRRQARSAMARLGAAAP